MVKRKNPIIIDDSSTDEELFILNEVHEIAKYKKTIQTLIPNDLKLIAKNESQKILINSIKKNQITICSGIAGTGKTFCALAYALNLIRKSSNTYKQIYLVKSVVQLKEEELGYLKGSVEDKTMPVMWSYFINIEKLIQKRIITELMNNDIIKPFPLTFMRGASLDNCIIIIDECQNVTLDNMRTMMTRIGTDCKLIMLGDVNQIDIKNKNQSSLEVILDIFEDVDTIGVVRMDENDINVRNPLISIIEAKFKKYYHGK
jgi:phosphate starvation-inducible PhoH-like protein